MTRIIVIQFTRDQCNTVVKDFFAFFDIWLESRKETHKLSFEDHTAWRVTSMIYYEMFDQFLRKLKKPGNDITIRLSQPEGCILFLMTYTLPIDLDKVWMNNIITLIRESLKNQMFLPEIK